LELTFSCIRSRGGWNANPNALQFKWALRQMLFNNAIKPSLNANCLGDDADICSILHSCLKKKNVDKHSKETNTTDENEQLTTLMVLIDKVELSAFQQNILYYITGSIIHKLVTDIKCPDCMQLLLAEPVNTDHIYTIDNKYASFTTFINRGKLLFPSHESYFVIAQTEKSFKAEINAKMMGTQYLKQNIITAVVTNLLSKNFRFEHSHPVLCNTEDEPLHEIQLTKLLISSYLNIRISTYAKQSTQQILGNRINMRQKLHKTILFNHV
ncbi:hypothetical protein X777_00114, partial [Ooceraea biroi]